MNNLMVQSSTPRLQLGYGILDRKSAEEKLAKLEPGTEEFFKLQDALIRTRGIVEIVLSSVSYKIDTSTRGNGLPGGFGPSEHICIGKGVILEGLEKEPVLIFRDKIELKFQDIIALAGDYYGIYDTPISLGKVEEKSKRFKEVFKTLAEASSWEVGAIQKEIMGEYEAVSHSGLPHYCYSRQLMDKNNAIQKIKGNIGDLLIDNSDHFFNKAVDAYFIGHNLAMEKAKKATDVEGLKKAYAIEAFACHFLTDLFAAGHIRNQRGELEEYLINRLGSGSWLGKRCAALLTAAQHEKDGNEGLNVKNKQGDYWRALGDGGFLCPKNIKNKTQAIKAVQQSVNEIHSAYKKENINSIMDQLIPEATKDNPSRLYDVSEDGTSLHFNTKKGIVKITTLAQYIRLVAPLALNNLPKDYVAGFVDGMIDNTKNWCINKISVNNLIPQSFKEAKEAIDASIGNYIGIKVNRLTASVWSAVGLASSCRMNENHLELTAQIGELASNSQSIFDNTEKILEQLNKIDNKVTGIQWNQTFQFVNKIIDQIVLQINMIHRNKQLSRDVLKKIKPNLFEAQSDLCTIFLNKLPSHKDCLNVYRTMLSQTQQLSEMQAKTKVTLWFREIINLQTQAFNYYGFISRLESLQDGILETQIADFQKGIADQIECNKNYIDEDLIFATDTYIKNYEHNLVYEKTFEKFLSQ